MQLMQRERQRTELLFESDWVFGDAGKYGAGGKDESEAEGGRGVYLY
jgi:hypothetical protein